MHTSRFAFLRLLKLTLLGGFLLSGSVFTQSSPPMTSATSEPETEHVSQASSLDRLPVAADGAKNPEKIPTDLAYRHFLRAVATRGTDASADAIRRRVAHLSRIRLSATDENALSGALLGLGDDLDRIDISRRAASLGSPTAALELLTLRSQERDILDGARQRLGSALSADGIARLDTYVQDRIRPRIVIYGELPQ